MEFVTDLSPWDITLQDGGIVRVWATAYCEESGDHVFSALARMPVEDQKHVQVLAHTPVDPEQVDVALARIPSDMVAKVRSA